MNEYWRGAMNWPIDKDWVCETCGQNCGLEWGLVNGQCRCNICHTQYHLREDKTILTRPVCNLKEEYKSPAIWLWKKYQKPLSEFLEDDWDEAKAVVEQEESVPT